MSAPERSLTISSRAQQDYDDILVYTTKTWGPDQADRYDAALDRALQSLLDFPHSGRPQNHLFAGCRARQVERHVIYYRLSGSEIVVVRILHERADASRHVRP